MRPTAEQFAPPYQPNFSTSDARYVDELYHHLIGSLPPNSSDSARQPPSGSTKR
jgi:hypothetical protein